MITSRPGGDLTPASAASRKSQGAAGAFDVNLPLTGATGNKNRGGPGEIVFTFTNQVTGASVTSTWEPTGNIKVDPSDAHNLLGEFKDSACDQTVVTGTLNDVTDDQGHTLDSASVTFAILFGVVTANAGHVIDNLNFRADINTDGRINHRDIGHLKTYVGNQLPYNGSSRSDSNSTHENTYSPL